MAAAVVAAAGAQAVVAAVVAAVAGKFLRPAARAIVIKDGQLLVMKRKNALGRKYMVTPGGRLEPGEDHVEALMRELAEETMITVSNPKLVFIEEPNDGRWGTQFIYLCEYVSGEPELHPDSEEMHDNALGKNLYEPLWVSILDLPDAEYPFRSGKLGQEIVYGVKNGFPDQPKQWTL